MEEQLQAQLVLRNNRQVSLTRAGSVFLAEARKLLNAMNNAADLARATDQGIIGHLSVGATASALFILLPDIVTRFKAALPHVRLHLHHMTTAEQETALRNEDIQVGICHPPLSDPGLDCDLLAELRFDLVLSEQNPLAQKPRLSLKDLSEQTFILFPRDVGPRLHDHIISLCHQEGFSPRQIVEASPAQSIVAMAACNVGVGFIASKVQHHHRPPAIFRQLSGPAPYFTLGAAYASRKVTTMLGQFLDIAQEVGAAAD